jgi:hypothetical protein
LGEKAVGDNLGRISRAIVQDDNFVGETCLMREAVEAPLKVQSAVLSDDNDADFGIHDWRWR